MTYTNEQLSREFYRVVTATSYGFSTSKMQNWADVLAKTSQNINEVYDNDGNLEAVLSDLLEACRKRRSTHHIRLLEINWPVEIIKSIFLFGTDYTIEEILRNQTLTKIERGNFRTRCVYNPNIPYLVKKSKKNPKAL